jgi:hypothetical protein
MSTLPWEGKHVMTEITGQIQKVYLDKHDEGTVTCPNCQKSKRMNLTTQKGRREVLKVKCGCGCAFGIRIEQRRYYRKKTQLLGHYAVPGTTASGSIVMEDLSFTGIGFRTRGPHTLQLGDLVEIRFLLDDQRASELCKKAMIKRIRGPFIGAEFCDLTAYDKTLGFYLMPT